LCEELGEKCKKTPNLEEIFLLPQLLDARQWQLKFFEEPLTPFAYKINV
jgi:hypothetical protein